MKQITDKDRAQMLAYALGFAIGTLQSISMNRDVHVEGLEDVIERLRGMAEMPIYYHESLETEST